MEQSRLLFACNGTAHLCPQEVTFKFTFRSVCVFIGKIVISSSSCSRCSPLFLSLHHVWNEKLIKNKRQRERGYEGTLCCKEQFELIFSRHDGSWCVGATCVCDAVSRF